MPLRDDDIEYIQKQYFSCTPINKFKLRESNIQLDGPVDFETQIKIFEKTIDDPDSIEYPPRLSYRIAFLRKLIEKFESNGSEVYDKLYETLTSYMMLNDGASPTHYRKFLLKQPETRLDRIILQESTNLISEGTTGLRTWQAGFSLAEWCYKNKGKINGKLVLELGSGIGLTGICVISTCSPKRYTFSDCHSSVLDMLVKNVRLNLAKHEDTKVESNRTVEWREESYRTNYETTDVRITRLAWSSVEESCVNASWGNPDVVLAADVIYDETLFNGFVEALKVFITRSNALVIVAATIRNNETLSAFFTMLDEYGLSYEDEIVPNPHLFLQWDDTPVRILKIRNN